MQPIGVFAVAIGILSFVLLAIISIRDDSRPRAPPRRADRFGDGS